MLLRCPICNNEVDSTALRMEWGAGGGYHCPVCNEPVRISLPYRIHVALLSLVIAVGILIVLRVRNPVAFLFLTAVIWVPISLLLNAASSRIKPPKLKAQRPPYGRHAYDLLAKGDRAEPSASTQSAHDQEPHEPNSHEAPE
jgi:hypothetical protein